MGSVFAPKKPDTSRQQALLAKQEEATARQEEETRRRDTGLAQTRKARRSARASLITGGETGALREQLG